MRDPRYWQSGNPERQAYVYWVTRGFQALYGEGNASKAGSVWVEPYSRMRDGRKEDVSGHWRSHKPGVGGEDDATPTARRPRDDMFPKHSEGGGPMGPGGGGGGGPRPAPAAPATTSPPRPYTTPETLRSGASRSTSARVYDRPGGEAQWRADWDALEGSVEQRSNSIGESMSIRRLPDGRIAIMRESRANGMRIEIHDPAASPALRFKLQYGHR